MSSYFLIPALFLSSLLGTLLMRGYALRSGILDVPNARSSHTRVTPRGGGLAIACTFGIAVLILGLSGRVPFELSCALLVAGGMIAVVGWLDDKISLHARTRAAVHLLSTLFGLGVSGYWGFRLQLDESWAVSWPLSAIFAILALIWLTNLYNFMDGIDGIAGAEGVYLGLILGGFAMNAGATGLGLLFLSLAACCGGFLVMNWQPARIFMGDVGSGFIGFVFGMIVLWADQAGAISLTTSFIVAGVFIGDATYTLIQRFLIGHRVYEAHRSHGYQKLVQSGWSHQKTVWVIMAINVFWLTPCAVAAQLGWGPRIVWVGVGYLPLFAALHRLRAGKS